jgi:hypothetical protein
MGPRANIYLVSGSSADTWLRFQQVQASDIQPRLINADSLPEAQSSVRAWKEVPSRQMLTPLLRVTAANPIPGGRGSIPILDRPEALSSLVYDAWLLNIAAGAVLTAPNADALLRQASALLKRRGCTVHTYVAGWALCTAAPGGLEGPDVSGRLGERRG